MDQLVRFAVTSSDIMESNCVDARRLRRRISVARTNTLFKRTFQLVLFVRCSTDPSSEQVQPHLVCYLVC